MLFFRESFGKFLPLFNHLLFSFSIGVYLFESIGHSFDIVRMYIDRVGTSGFFQARSRDVYKRQAWAIDRLSILALKIYHMQQEVERTDTTEEHRAQCQTKLNILLEQRKDLSTAIEQLLADIEAGRKYMKVYKQMKMYNDPALNPVLYAKK